MTARDWKTGCRGRLNSARNVEGDFDMSILVMYFSQTGTTKAVAEKIAEIKKADLIEISPERLYQMSYLKTVMTSLKEKFTKARPELAMEVPDMQKYDRVLIGFPKLVRYCAECGSDAVRFLKFSRKTCGRIYDKRRDEAGKACRKLEKVISGGKVA